MKKTLNKISFGVLATIIICLTISCQFESNTNLETDSIVTTIPIDLDVDFQDIHSIGLISDVDIIPLSNDILMGEIDKVIKHDGYLFFLDRKNSVVDIFDSSGNFINRINDMGRGNKEYSGLADILIDENEKSLKLISRLDEKIFSYHLDGSEQLKVEKLPKRFDHVSKTKNGYIGFTGNDLVDSASRNVWTFSADLKLEKGYLKINPNFNSWTHGNLAPFSRYNEDMYYVQMMDNQVYTINDQGVIAKYIFDFGDHNWPKNIQTLAQMDEMTLMEKNKYVENLYFFQETPNFLISKILYQGQHRICVYNKESKESFAANLDPYVDQYFFSFGSIISVDQNAIYALIDPLEIKDKIVGKDKHGNDFEKNFPEQIKRLRAKFSDLNIKVLPILRTMILQY